MATPSTSELKVHLPDSGTNFLWAVTGIFLLAFLIVLVFCFTAPESDRVFHYLYVVCLLVGSVTYFAQAANYGWTTVVSTDGTYNMVYWAKYVYWVVAWPSVSLGLGLLSGLSWVTMVMNVAIAWLWVLAFLAGAFVNDSYKWGFFAFGTFSWLMLAMSSLNEGREAAERVGIKRDYMLLAGWSNLIWICYPVAYALTDAHHSIDANGGVIFFGVLDILFVPVLSLAFSGLGRGWNFEQLNLPVSEKRDNPALQGPSNGAKPRDVNNSESTTV